MIIVMKPGASEENISRVKEKIERAGLSYHLSVGETRTIVGVIGDKKIISSIEENMSVLDGVEKAVRITEKYKLVSREFHPEPTVVDVRGFKIGGEELAIMAGPCAVESMEQLREAASEVKKGGAQFLRGGAFKPRTSPYSFQGLGKRGLEILIQAKRETGLPVVTELMRIEHLDLFNDVDVIQIGARNMQNFDLLKEVGAYTKKPVLLKRGMSASLQELLMSAEYVMASGNPNVILCERGIRTFETAMRNTLDLAVVPMLHRLSHLPVIVDPSHATGYAHLVDPVSVAAAAIGADGLIIEVHNDPPHAKCDGAQSQTPEMFTRTMARIRRVREVL